MLLLIILSACAPKSDPSLQVEQAVAATLAALPQPTTPPLPTPQPTATQFDLRGLFCEYQFCIGHPADMAFFDVSAQNNPASPSTYSQGLIAAFNGTLFIQLIWQLAPGTSDPQFMLDLILTRDVDTRVGNLDVKLIRDMNVIYTPITSTATPVLPFGASAAWICGDRAFAWKVYSPRAENTQALFDEAFNRFECKR
ncbi:MAG: hypothetical protein C3F07_04410 [Anaerolineales bacterium]|nr:MAG: hypothetical protein C3F07_04410 [Anaerolineales bacterium]